VETADLLALTERFGRALATAQHAVDLLNPGIKGEQLRQAIEGFRFRRAKDPAVIAALKGVVLLRATPEELEAVRERLTPPILAFFKTTISELVAPAPS
jgi:hypothetical protein